MKDSPEKSLRDKVMEMRSLRTITLDWSSNLYNDAWQEGYRPLDEKAAVWIGLGELEAAIQSWFSKYGWRIDPSSDQ